MSTKRHLTALDVYGDHSPQPAKITKQVEQQRDTTVLRSSSSSLVQNYKNAEAFEEALLGKIHHHVTRVTLPCDSVVPKPAGVGEVLRLLTLNIGIAVKNSHLVGPYVSRELLLLGPALCGLTSAVRYFCQRLGVPITIFRFHLFYNPAERLIEFWLNFFQVAERYPLCIIIVHRISARGDQHSVDETLASIRAALNANEDHRFWIIFIDSVDVLSRREGWSFSPENIALFTYPSPQERAQCLSETLRTHLRSKLSAERTDLLMAKYDPLITNCVGSIAPNQELDLGVSFAIRKFVTDLFRSSIAHNVDAYSEELQFVPDDMFPTEADFEWVKHNAPRREIQTRTVCLRSEQAQRQPYTQTQDDIAMLLNLRQV